jgi:hypothetical protein
LEVVVYDELGLVAALRAKGQILAFMDTGDGGLGGRRFNDLSAETALVYCELVGVVGGEK